METAERVTEYSEFEIKTQAINFALQLSNQYSGSPKDVETIVTMAKVFEEYLKNQ